MLGLHAEEEGRGEVQDVVDADHVTGRQLGLQVAVGERHQEPDHGEQQPRHEERGGEPEDRPDPGQFDQACEKILEKSKM